MQDDSGRTVLHHLAALNYVDARAEARAVEAIVWLRSFDGCPLSDVNPKTGLTPLHRAVLSDNKAFALALVDAGASLTACSHLERRTPPDVARDEQFRQASPVFLCSAVPVERRRHPRFLCKARLIFASPPT